MQGSTSIDGRRRPADANTTAENASCAGPCGKPRSRTSCAGGGNCRDLTYVDFDVDAADGVSPPSRIGYLFEAEGAKLAIGSAPIVPSDKGRIRIYLNGTVEAEGRDFDVRVSAVDEAGNVSVDSVVVTIDRSGGGCGVAARHHDGILWALAMLAVVVRRSLVRRHAMRGA